MVEVPSSGVVLRLWLVASRWLAPLAGRHLARRVARGKEDPARVGEKQGSASLPRPKGPLIWLHAVGVGEVLALPALVAAIRDRNPEIQVLITSSSRTSAEALATNLPAGSRHQFLPLDCLPYVQRFLDHWRPDLVVWAERDIWPAMVVETHRRGIPQMLVNGRMDDASFRAKMRARGLFRDLYGRMASVGVQDPATLAHFAAFGVARQRLFLDGSLKAGAAALADQPEPRTAFELALAGRRVWLAASTHAADEATVAAAHAALLRSDPDACLIVAPRDPSRAGEVQRQLQTEALDSVILTGATLPARTPACVVGRIGQLGIWYRIADVAFVGGSLGQTGGHNPYEAARLECAIVHGPNIANFADDYAAFHGAGAARLVRNAADLLAALLDPDLQDQLAPARAVALRGVAGLQAVAIRILAQMASKQGPA